MTLALSFSLTLSSANCSVSCFFAKIGRGGVLTITTTYFFNWKSCLLAYRRKELKFLLRVHLQNNGILIKLCNNI